MKLYRKVECKDRLPEDKKQYITSKGYCTYFPLLQEWGQKNIRDGYWVVSVIWWLEEVDLPSEEDVKNFLQSLVNIKPLLEYPIDTSPEYYDEAQVISAMLSEAEALLNKLKS